MIFNSVTFVAFLAIVLPLHWFVPVARRNLVLLVASYVFYGWWDWRFLGLIALSTVVDFAIGRRLGGTTSDEGRKRLLAASLGFNLGVLGVFKYFDFFVDGAVDARELGRLRRLRPRHSASSCPSASASTRSRR